MALAQVEHVEDVDMIEEPRDMNSFGYQRWLGERSCTEYSHARKKGIIKYTNDQWKVDYMFDKRAKMIICDSDLAIFLVTEVGEVYHWWDIEVIDPYINYYSQIIDLRNTRVVLTAAGGKSTFIMLTDDGRVYYFQTYHEDVLSGWMRQMDLGKKVICLSCGDSFFVVITEDNKIYSWGKNNHGQLGVSIRAEDFTQRHFTAKPQEIRFSDTKIVKVACGYTHTLALTEKGEMYVWGGNVFGELGFNHRQDILTPIMVEIHLPIILDITAMRNMSAIVSEDKLVHLWGSCFDQQINEPIVCEYTTIFDVCNALCARPPTSVKNYNPNEKLKILNDLKATFNDELLMQETHDFVIRIKGQDIYVHKIILQLRSSYFKNYFESLKSSENIQNINFDEFPYDIYYAYLKYLYTGVIDVALDEKFVLLRLAYVYNEEKLKNSCYQAIRKEITAANVFSIYRRAKECGWQKLEEYCFDFFVENAINIIEMTSFTKLDVDTKDIFLTRAGFNTNNRLF